MATTTLPELPVPGTYRIVQYGVQGQPQILTVNKDRNVTITAAGTVPERNQEVHLAFLQSLWFFTYQPQLFFNSGRLKSRGTRSPFNTLPIFAPRVLFLTKANLSQERRLSLGYLKTFPLVYGILNMHPTYQDHSGLTCQSNTALVFPSIFLINLLFGSITVPGEDLRVVISPKAIFPPQACYLL